MPIRPLPDIMVAPNGARRIQADHPALPLDDDALLSTAIDCVAAGAGGLHAHIRDDEGRHLLDADRYRALLARLRGALPESYHQVTSEAAGRYCAADQMQLVRDLRPAHVSIALREVVPTQSNWPEAERFFVWAAESDIAIQHILYSPQDLVRFLTALRDNRVKGKTHLLLFVLGNYEGTQISRPQDIAVFTDLLADAPAGVTFDWMLCAFGQAESACLIEAFRQGGKARIGFENSLWHADGRLAASNAERVAELVYMRRALSRP